MAEATGLLEEPQSWFIVFLQLELSSELVDACNQYTLGFIALFGTP
jgi:hypothetical protein